MSGVLLLGEKLNGVAVRAATDRRCLHRSRVLCSRFLSTLPVPGGKNRLPPAVAASCTARILSTSIAKKTRASRALLTLTEIKANKKQTLRQFRFDRGRAIATQTGVCNGLNSFRLALAKGNAHLSRPSPANPYRLSCDSRCVTCDLARRKRNGKSSANQSSVQTN